MSTLRAPNSVDYPIKSTTMRGDDLWVCLDTTMPERPPSCRWFMAFDLAGHWQVNHATIDRLRGVIGNHRIEAVDMGIEYTCAEPPAVTCTALAIWRPVIEVPIDQLGFYRPGKKGVPGMEMTLSNVLVVLIPPEGLAA